MPPTKVIPHAPCEWCRAKMERKRYGKRLEDAGVFRRRKFCDIQCMSAAFDARPSRATSPVANTPHYHARKIVPPGPCQSCVAPMARDVHHLNWDRTDNRATNLVRLCRSCHMRLHRYADSPPPNVSDSRDGPTVGLSRWSGRAPGTATG